MDIRTPDEQESVDQHAYVECEEPHLIPIGPHCGVCDEPFDDPRHATVTS